jgi:hypothetical protein
LLANEVDQFWQNLLSELVGFPLDGGSSSVGSVRTSITTDSTVSASVSNSTVVVSSVEKVWKAEKKGDEEEEWESYEDETGGYIITPAL